MEILKQGTRKEDRTYEAACRDCGTEVRFHWNEAKYIPSGRCNSAYLTIPCPICDWHIDVSV